MRKALLLLLIALAWGQARGQLITTDPRTPAEQRLAWARAALNVHPGQPQPYNDLAAAFIARARETGDPGCYDQAEAALQFSLNKDPHNIEALKIKAMILLGRREFEKAIELTQKLNQENPDDVLIHGLLADGLMESGKYEQAVAETQWMLNLRSGNVPGLIRAARLRWIHGDREGSLDLYTKAYQQISPTQTEDQAWTLTQMADIQIATGHLDIADQLVGSALKRFPGYYLSLESSARLQTARKHYTEAAVLLRQRNESFPTLESRYELAKALELAGEPAEAKSVFTEFEDLALRLSDTPRNANRELTFYYLSILHKPADALRIAANEVGKRQDIATLDTYAWALCINGQYVDADKQIKAALATDIRDAEILFHAGVIAEKVHDYLASANYLKASLGLNPWSAVSQEAQRALDAATAIPVAAALSH